MALSLPLRAPQTRPRRMDPRFPVLRTGMLLLLGLLGACRPERGLAPRGEPALPPYVAPPTLEGHVCVRVDGETRVLAEQWVRRFRTLHPRVTLEVSERGAESRTAEQNTVALLGRRRSFQEGSRETASTLWTQVALEPLGILIHRDNPLRALDLGQLEALCQAASAPSLRRWEALGVGGSWGARPFVLLLPTPTSGRGGACRDQLVGRGSWAPPARFYGAPGELYAHVGHEPSTLAIGPLDGLPPHVKVIPLQLPTRREPIFPEASTLRQGSYPLVHYLYLSAQATPGTPLSPAAAAFVRFCFSREGQALLPSLGLVPVPPDVAKAGQTRLLF